MCQETSKTTIIELLETMAAIDPQHYLAQTCKAVILYLNKNYRKALTELEHVISMEPNEWDAYFWKAMACASLKQDNDAVASLEQAMANGFPPALLASTQWLEQSRPDFYKKHVIPILVHND
jgi:tetratricopeptide (TPR) repeat protein